MFSVKRRPRPGKVAFKELNFLIKAARGRADSVVRELQSAGTLLLLLKLQVLGRIIKWQSGTHHANVMALFCFCFFSISSCSQGVDEQNKKDVKK